MCFCGLCVNLNGQLQKIDVGTKDIEQMKMKVKKYKKKKMWNGKKRIQLVELAAAAASCFHYCLWGL